MIKDPSRSFEALLTGLEALKRSLTDKRRSYTKNLVAQTNDEVRSGMPYVVDVAGLIAKANGAELFLEELINGLRTNSRSFGESIAMKRALGSVMAQLKEIDGGSVSAPNLYEIGSYLMDAISGVELRDVDS